MTTNRARAYGRVMDLIADLGPAKLHAGEQQAIRDAADALLFSMDLASDPEAGEALQNLEAVVDRLVETERLLDDTARHLLETVEACGPQTELLPTAA